MSQNDISLNQDIDKICEELAEAIRLYDSNNNITSIDITNYRGDRFISLRSEDIHSLIDILYSFDRLTSKIDYFVILDDDFEVFYFDIGNKLSLFEKKFGFNFYCELFGRAKFISSGIINNRDCYNDIMYLLKNKDELKLNRYSLAIIECLLKKGFNYVLSNTIFASQNLLDCEYINFSDYSDEISYILPDNTKFDENEGKDDDIIPKIIAPIVGCDFVFGIQVNLYHLDYLCIRTYFDDYIKATDIVIS